MINETPTSEYTAGELFNMLTQVLGTLDIAVTIGLEKPGSIESLRDGSVRPTPAQYERLVFLYHAACIIAGRNGGGKVWQWWSSRQSSSLLRSPVWEGILKGDFDNVTKSMIPFVFSNPPIGYR